MNLSISLTVNGVRATSNSKTRELPCSICCVSVLI